MKREGKDFSGRITPLFATMIVQPTQDEGVDSGIPTDHLQTPITTQPLSSRSQKKQSRRKQRKDTAVTQEETQQDDSVPTPSNDPPLSGEDSMQLSKLMILCTNLQTQVQGKGCSTKGDCCFKEEGPEVGKEKGIKNYRRRSDNEGMFDTNNLYGDEVNIDMTVGEKQEQSEKEREVDTSVEDSAAPTTIEEITLAQTLIQIKAAKPKVVTTAATTTTRLKARGVVVQEPKEQGEITIEERSRLFVELMNKRKKHFAMLRVEEKRRKPPTKDQKRNLMSTYLKNMGGYKHNQLKSKSYEEIQKLFDNEMRRVNTFIPIDSEEVKSKKGTEESSKGTEDELKSDKSKKAESSEEKAKGSRKKILGKKRARKEQQQESLKRQRMEDDKETYEHEEVEIDDESELKKHLVIVKDDDIAIDTIPLATKPPVIVEYKLLKEGIMVHYQLIRADGSFKRYSSMIRMLQDIDREDLETL
ncbi:hypothetical protein Tco_0779691 [Tanacetum coccineum]